MALIIERALGMINYAVGQRAKNELRFADFIQNELQDCMQYYLSNDNLSNLELVEFENGFYLGEMQNGKRNGFGIQLWYKDGGYHNFYMGHWNDDYKCDIEKQKNAAIEIVKFAKNYSDHKADYKSRYNSNTYFISRSTIWNTRALIAAGYEVELEKWMDLDKLDKMLQNGDKLVNIRVNNGGDGVAEDALFTFGGWDGEDVFENMSGVEVLGIETM